MSDNGIFLPQSTIALVLKNGTQVTSNSIDKSDQVLTDYESPLVRLKIVDAEHRVLIVEKSDIALFSVGPYESEEDIARKMRAKATNKPPAPINRSGLIVPR